MNLTEPIKNKQSPFNQHLVEQLRFIPGIWVNGKVFWLQNSAEKVIYEEELIVKLKQEFIHSKICLSKLYVGNHSRQVKEIKLLAMHHLPCVGQEHFAFVSPTENKIYHLANKNVYLVNGQYNGVGIKDCTVQPSWNIYTDKIWNCLEKGNLRYQPMAKGSVASIFAMHMSVEPRETRKMATWTISGTNKNELISMDQAVLKNTLAFPFEK